MDEWINNKGFVGEQSMIVPPALRRQIEKTPLVNSLYVTNIGYIPNAENHFVERSDGIDQYVFVFCAEGQGELVIEKQNRIIISSDYFVVPAGKKHKYCSDKKHPWSIYWIHFNGLNANALCEIILQRMDKGLNNIVDKNSISELFYDIFKLMKKGNSLPNLIQSTVMLHNYISSFIFNNQPSKQTRANRNNDIEIVVNYLRKNIDKQLSLKEIASKVNCSPNHFSNKFKKIMGYPPIEYFIQLKMQKACCLLRTTDLRINEVALSVGIDDPYYFSRLFSSHLGISPKEFRINNQYF